MTEPTVDTRCVCDGRYDGCDHANPCGGEVRDDRWGPWCSGCNPIRLASIQASLEEIRASVGGGQ